MTLGITKSGRYLIIWGAVMFLIGVLQGGALDIFTNPRMALSAHLTAVQSGTALMVFGVVWSLVTLSSSWRQVAKHTLNIGMYLIWFAITLAAVFGASEAMPIAGTGHTANATSELIVTGTVGLGAVLAIVGTLLAVVGLCRSNAANLPD